MSLSYTVATKRRYIYFTNKWLKINSIKRVKPKLGLDCGSFGSPRGKSLLEISKKYGASSSIATQSLKFKLKGGKGYKLSQESLQMLMQAQESDEEEAEEETTSEKECLMKRRERL